MQQAAKKRLSFYVVRSTLRNRENKVKSQRVYQRPLSCHFFPAFYRRHFLSRRCSQVAIWLRYFIIREETEREEERETRLAANSTTTLIKFFLFALVAVTSFGFSMRPNRCLKEKVFTWYSVAQKIFNVITTETRIGPVIRFYSNLLSSEIITDL